MGKVFSRDISGAIGSFLHNDDWRFSFDENRGIFRFGLGLKGKMKTLDYIIDVKKDAFITYAISPLSADSDDPQMMAQMAEFLTRANYGLKNGCFEMDFDDGELRYRSFVDCDGQVPSSEVVRNSIYVTASTFQRYAPGILDIIFGGIGAKEAIAKCEGKTNELLRQVLAETSSDDPDVSAMLSRLSARLGLGSNPTSTEVTLSTNGGEA